MFAAQQGCHMVFFYRQGKPLKPKHTIAQASVHGDAITDHFQPPFIINSSPKKKRETEEKKLRAGERGGGERKSETNLIFGGV